MSKVGKSIVGAPQVLNKAGLIYTIGPRSPTIHRPQGIRWPQFLNCLLVLCLFSVGKFSNFFVQYKAAGVCKNVVRMNILCLFVLGKFSNFYYRPPGGSER